MATPNKPTPQQIARFKALRQQHPDWSRAQLIAAAETEVLPTSRATPPPAIPAPTGVPMAARDVTRVAPTPVEPNLVSGAGPTVSTGRLEAPTPWNWRDAFSSGFLAGGLDELGAGVDALRRGTNYDDEIVRQQRAEADYFRANPMGRMVQGAGAVASLLGPAEARAGKFLLGEAPSLARRILVPLGLGTATGAGVGALSAPAGQRTEGAVLGGLGGTVVGGGMGLIPPALRGMRNLAGAPSSDAAERIALGDMASAQTTVPQMRSRLEGMSPNEPVTIGELIGEGPRSPSVQTQRAAYQVPGPGQAATGRGLGAAEGSVIDRVAETVQGVSGVPRSNVVTRLEEMQNAIREQAEPLYRDALERRGVVSDRQINAIVGNPVIQQRAIPAANEALQLRGLPAFPERGAPTATQLHYLKGAMDDLIDYSGPPVPGGLTARNQAALKTLRGEFNTALERAVPGYQRANERVAPLIRQRERFRQGADFSRTPVDELEANWSRWTGAERDAYREGAINAELSLMEQSAQTAGMDRTSVLANRFTSTSQRRKWRLLLGRDATQIQQYVERALNRSSANRSIMGGSQTMANAAGMARIGEEASAASAAGNAARGNLWGSLKDVLELGANRARGVNPRTAGQISDLYNAGIQTSPSMAGAPNRQALEDALTRLQAASARQGSRATAQNQSAATLAQIMAQLIGGQMTESAYPQ